MKQLSEAARRALAEAEARRAARDGAEAGRDGTGTARGATGGARERELGGRQGLDPVRHGDWENRGIASDF